jgi:hypothetical protein
LDARAWASWPWPASAAPSNSTTYHPATLAANTWETTRDVLASKQNKVGSTVISQYDYAEQCEPMRAFSRTVSSSIRLKLWKTKPMCNYSGL